MKYLPPLPLRNGYWVGLDKVIASIFWETIYQPCYVLFGKDDMEMKNTGQALLDAIANGTVWYDDGHFAGTYNATITRELRQIGAIYNTPSRTWSLARQLLPTDIRMVQAHADMRYDSLRRGFLRALDDLDIKSINWHEKTRDSLHHAIEWMDDDFKKSVEAITIPPTLTQMQKKLIATEYGDNLDKYIKSWADERILKLRADVQANTFEGRRSIDLVELLRNDYGVSRRKAEFLARQETSLMMSKFRESRYRDVGVQRYRWSTAHDERVRHDHKDLNGKIFDWSNPPVTNRRTGKRNSPGEDFGCRCVAVAIVE